MMRGCQILEQKMATSPSGSGRNFTFTKERRKDEAGNGRKKGRNVRCTSSVRGDFDDLFYQTPDSKLLTILIIVAIVISVFFLWACRHIVHDFDLSDSTNGVTSAYLGIIGVPVGVALAFIVQTTWASFSDAQSKENEEATKLLLLYNLLDAFPGAEDIQESIRVYTRFIITDEFPLMEKGIQSIEGLAMITAIQDAIYALNPTNDQETVLYDEAIAMLQDAMALRIARMGYAVYGLASELWWVLIFGVVVVLIMSFFLYCKSFKLHAVLVGLSAAVLSSLLFLIVVLNYPYRGSFGLDSLPFEIALGNMVSDRDTDEQCDTSLKKKMKQIRAARRAARRAEKRAEKRAGKKGEGQRRREERRTQSEEEETSTLTQSEGED